MRFSLRLIYEETNYFNDFDEIILNGLGARENLIGAFYICVRNAG